jgi:hypothetical protein
MNLPSWGAQFPHRVEIVAPGRPAGLQTMMHWCIGKAYRVTPASPQPGKPAVWHFAEADDAEAFKAAFSRKR